MNEGAGQPVDLACLEREIDECVADEKTALQAIESGIVALATAKVEAGRRLNRILAEHLFAQAGFENFSNYLRARDSEGRWKYATARFWMKAARVCEDVTELASHPTKAAALAGLDAEVLKLLAPIVVDPDLTVNDTKTLAKGLIRLEPKQQVALVKAALASEEIREEIARDPEAAALVSSASGRNERAMFKRATERRWNERRSDEIFDRLLQLANQMSAFVNAANRSASELIERDAALTQKQKQWLKAKVGRVEVVVLLIKKLLDAEEPAAKANVEAKP